MRRVQGCFGCMAWWRAGLLCLLLSAIAWSAQAADAPASAPALAPALVPANASDVKPASIMLFNREIAVFRGDYLGWPPQARAAAATQRIDDLLKTNTPGVVDVRPLADGYAVEIDGHLMFLLVPQDTLERTAAAAQAEATQAAQRLRQAIGEVSESRSLKAMLLAAAVAALATLVLVAVLWGLLRLRRRTETWLVNKTLQHSAKLRLGEVPLLGDERLVQTERTVLKLLYWFFVLLAVYQWLGIVLKQFPFTRAWGEQINGFLLGLVSRFALAIVHAVPDLLAAALIFVLAHWFTRILKQYFANVQTGRITPAWLAPDVALTTSRLCVFGVWMFALAMAYPYLPGSQTEAFRGLSVLVGLMISLGASNLVGQLASGLILTYTRTFHAGEYVRVGSDEGTVVSLGTFTTRIRTGMGEELTISNSQILGAVTRNYSRAVKGQGFIVDTTVTIGYDTPWRQVSAMLVEAARRTPGVLADPAPHVYQTALSDFYPEYRLVCQAAPSEPRPRAEVMSLLHANVQDVFNEHGVQIMSPHYLGDPQAAKVVPREHWYDAPATPPANPEVNRE